LGADYRARVLDATRRPILIAHRVGNAIEQVPAAVAAGADLIEADIHLYRRRLEVRHTKTLGLLPWLWDRWYLVPVGTERLVLRTLVESTPADAMLMLDLKGWHPWLGHRIASAMHDVAPGRPYVVAGRQWQMLSAFESLDHVQIIHSARSPRELKALPRRIAGHRTDAICVHRRLLANARWVELARSLAPTLLTWPIVDQATADEARSLGADGLIIDGIDLIESLAAQRTG
jgi:glycerophosphoryl diester phosphodiesterase